VFVLKDVFGFSHAEIGAAVDRSQAAAAGGDINGLMELLSPDVTLWTDGGGKVRHARRPIVGADTVAAWFAALRTVTYEGVAPGDMRAELVDGRIVAIHNVANPDKLRAVDAGRVYRTGR
jgi:RNA polymerase sigma-70 factor (ECF subfamily)